MAGYQNILCATDFSKYSDAVFLRGRELAKLYDAKLTLLHVVEYFPEDRSNIHVSPENTDPMEYREKQAQSSLTDQVQRSGYENVKTAVRFSSHSAKQEIISFAKEQNNDLIIVASHGRHGITTLLGSTANGVVHNAPCDVLIVRANSE
jgi:universal stress protein A